MLLKTYSFAEVEAAFARSNAVALPNLKTGGGGGRDYRAQGASPYRAGTGHAYAHVATYTDRLPSSDPGMSAIRSGQAGKSLWQDRRTAIYACMELLNGDVKVREWLAKFDAGQRTDPIDVKNRPLAGDFYGYSAGDSNNLKKATSAAINIMAVGTELGIYSAYPCNLAGFVEPALDLGWLFAPAN